MSRQLLLLLATPAPSRLPHPSTTIGWGPEATSLWPFVDCFETIYLCHFLKSFFGAIIGGHFDGHFGGLFLRKLFEGHFGGLFLGSFFGAIYRGIFYGPLQGQFFRAILLYLCHLCICFIILFMYLCHFNVFVFIKLGR